MQKEVMMFDFLIVGAGPAGLAAAIRLAQMGQQQRQPPKICIIEKGESVGAHILSGAVLDPKSLNSLLPDWRERHPPPFTPVMRDRFYYLSRKKKLRLPVPPQMKNPDSLIISLGRWCQWLADQAEQLGVNIFPGFPATEVITEQGQIKGIITGDQGRNRKGEPTSRFQPGIELRARQTLFAEGCRGFLSEQLMRQFNLRQAACPQTYALGIKELWEISSEHHEAGTVIHSVGWPLPHDTYGGSFLYHAENNRLAIGFVTGLDYTNPWLNPYELFQQWKTHSMVASLLADGRRIAYGARCLNEGGLQSLPHMVLPGGLLIGCAAGFLNVPKMKGIHTAIQSGILAAESVFSAAEGEACESFTEKYRSSWIHKELYTARNIRPSMQWGLWPGLILAAIDTFIFRGHAPWTFRRRLPDHLTLKLATQCIKPVYPSHDDKITFDRLSSVYLAYTHHDENQPSHLKIKNADIPVTVNLKQYAGPEQRYCPAGVYEFVKVDHAPPVLQINAANCVHCKACDIKDPTQNILWSPPEGSSGPKYQGM